MVAVSVAPRSELTARPQSRTRRRLSTAGRPVAGRPDSNPPSVSACPASPGTDDATSPRPWRGSGSPGSPTRSPPSRPVAAPASRRPPGSRAPDRRPDQMPDQGRTTRPRPGRRHASRVETGLGARGRLGRHRADPLATRHRIGAAVGDRLPAGPQRLRAERGVSGQHVTVVALIVAALVRSAPGGCWPAGRASRPWWHRWHPDAAAQAAGRRRADGTDTDGPRHRPRRRRAQRRRPPAAAGEVVVDVTGKVRHTWAGHPAAGITGR